MVKPRESGSSGSVQSLSRAFALLGQLGKAEVGQSLAELSGGVGLAPSTAHRLLSSMRHAGFVEYDEQAGLWSVGLQAFAVGNAYLKKRDFIAQARPFMKQLVAETGETSNLGVLDGDHHVFLSQVECSQIMRMVAQLGRPGPVHAAGVGKALLSDLPPASVRDIVQRAGLAQLTEHTLTSPEALAAELDRVRQQGYALDNEEQALGLRCIAANICDEHGDAIAAVSVSGPTVRIAEGRVAELGAVVMETAAKISCAIGGVSRVS